MLKKLQKWSFDLHKVCFKLPLPGSWVFQLPFIFWWKYPVTRSKYFNLENLTFIQPTVVQATTKIKWFQHFGLLSKDRNCAMFWVNCPIKNYKKNKNDQVHLFNWLNLGTRTCYLRHVSVWSLAEPLPQRSIITLIRKPYQYKKPWSRSISKSFGDSKILS